ncbi:MAG: sigma-70 family RNA polymerase sigma factor [Chloroflexi bacterium]|nr:sigma-70 family RNA polymerase sigma factor [Chloroflexota bacterium]
MSELVSLVVAAQRGDLDAFGELVRRFGAMAYACAYALVRDAHQAEDVAQEAFLEAYLNLPKLREPVAFPGWFRLMVFKHADRLMRGKRVTPMPFDEYFDVATPDVDPSAVVEAREASRLVHGAISALPEHERITTALFYLAGYSQREIAEYLEVLVSTVKKRLFDARAHLRSATAIAHESRRTQRPDAGERSSRVVQLALAVRAGDVDRAEALLDSTPELVNTHIESAHGAARAVPGARPLAGYTPLHHAALAGNTQLAELLLSRGADVSARSEGSETALHLAAVMDEPEIAALLFEHGADPNVTAATGLTPLHLAAMRGYAKLVTLLLAHGASVNIRDKGGRTPLFWATRNRHIAVGETLRNMGGK